MKDHLLDIVQHTHGLGVIDLVKVTGTENETTLEAIDQVNRLVIVKAKFNGPVPEFIGTFGMPNLNKLKILLNLQEYKEDAKLTMSKGNGGEPDGINFENKTSPILYIFRLKILCLVIKLKN